MARTPSGRRRPWDVRELEATNVRQLPVPDPKDKRVDLPVPGKLYRLPTTQASVASITRESSSPTRQVIRELTRLGYDVDEITDQYVVLGEVGQGRMTIVLHHSGELPVEIVRVVFAGQRWDAREGARWLRGRVAR